MRKEWVIGGLGALGVLMMIGSNLPPPGPSTEDVRHAVRETLKDPDSARFGPIAMHKVAVPNKGDLDVGCGTVNAKNSFGGYVGDKRFIAYPKASIALIDDGSVGFAGMWSHSCT